MLRRVEKTVSSGGSTTLSERYVYDNYLQVEKLNALDSNAILRKRIWSAEGKIIADVNAAGTTSYALGDANKNITEYLDASDTIQGHYEYSPFGKITVSSGSIPDTFDFRFSSEYFDTETSLVYYNYRYYSPDLGRWLSKDPIADIAFFEKIMPETINLYLFVLNNPVLGTDHQGLTSIGSILEEFFSWINRRPDLWVMNENDNYTKIVRRWAAVQGNIALLKQSVVANPLDWAENHITSPSWTPTMSYSPDPKNGWNSLVRSPQGTDPDTARKNFIIYVLTGVETEELHTSAIGSFRIIATADEIDLKKCRVKLNIWMYNEMSRQSFGRFANHILFRYRPMSSQFMWWNWKEEFQYDEQGNITNIPSSSGGGW